MNLTEIKKELHEKLDSLSKRSERITRKIRHHDDTLDSDFAEQATQRENDEVLDVIDQSIRTELARVRAALERIESGKYGECITCGNQINVKRLEVMPYSVRCIRCAR
jgi:RNA polymerase-binding transcription factor